MSDVQRDAADKKKLEPIAAELKDISAARPTGEWMVNIAHYMGKGHVNWSLSRKQLSYHVKFSREGVRASENRIMPVIEKLVALILQQIRPPQVVPPLEMSIAERNRIEASNALLKHLGQLDQLDDKATWELFLRYMCLTGVGVRMETWDPKRGQKYGGPGEEYFSGEHRSEVISPFDVFPQPYKSTIKEMDRFTIRRLSSVSEIKKLYDEKVTGDSQLSNVSAAEWQLRHLSEPHMGPEPAKDLKYVYLRFERPSDEYPEGRELHFTLQGEAPDRVLYDEANRCPGVSGSVGEIPIVMVPMYPLAMGWSASMASQLRQNNVIYNSLLGSVVGFTKNAMKETILVPDSAKVSEASLTEDSKNAVRIVHYNDAESPNPPIHMRHPGIPQGVFQTLGILDKGRDDVSSQHESMRGGVPGQLRSQPAVQEVRESDILPLQPIIDRVQSAVCHTGKLRLALARKYFTEKRTAQVMSDSDDWKAYDFKKSNLSESIQLEVPPTPLMPLSLDGKLNAITKMQSMGMDQNVINGLLSNVFHVDRLSDVASLERDHREAQREELETMMTGEPVGVNSFDNDAFHMDELDRFRNRNRRMYSGMKDIVKAQIQDHFESHKEQEFRKVMEEAQKQQALGMMAGPPMEQGGGGGGAPAPVEPPAQGPGAEGGA